MSESRSESPSPAPTATSVLYVNHTALISGGERSLLGLLQSLGDRVRACLATPPGPLADRARELGIQTTPITATAGSLRLHPLHTPRALLEMARAAIAVRRAAARHEAQIAHANSIRAGLILAIARPRDVASVVHVRDCLPPSALSRVTLRTIAASATTIVANSAYTARSVLAAAPGAQVEVVHNAVDLERFNPARLSRSDARARLRDAGEPLASAGERPLLLGVVGQLSPWKGQHVAIEVLRIVREQGLDAHLLVVGSAKFLARSTRLDNAAYVERLHELVRAAGLSERVSWLGEREDVPELLRALDVLLVPSAEEPFGRTVIEGMAAGVPVIATDVGGPAEILCDGREGFVLSPREPARWAAAIVRLAREPELATQLTRAARSRVERDFGAQRHLQALLAVYARALAIESGAARARARRGTVG